jgi:hypothetical protein
MPMYAGFEDVRAAVARAVDVAGLEMRRLEVEIADSAWHLWLLDSIDASDVVLVDLTGHNPFVMYELGYVHNRRRPTAFIVQAAEPRVPATVRGAAFLAYDPAGDGFEAGLTEELRCLGAGCGDGFPSIASAADIYSAAAQAAAAFNRDAGRDDRCVAAEEFAARLSVAARRGDPDPRRLTGGVGLRRLLALILEASDQVPVSQAIGRWAATQPSREPMTSA